MKLRLGFVSNSSSTSFCFLMKKFDLAKMYEIMRKYQDLFKLPIIDACWEDDLKLGVKSINVNDVIDAIKNIESELYCESVDELEKYLLKIRSMYVDYKEQSEKDMASNLLYYDTTKEYEEDIEEYDYKLKLIDEAKKLGLNACICICFGDHEGHVEGDPIGSTMDYEGRHIVINDPELVLFTEQNR